MTSVRIPSTSVEYVHVGPVRLEEDGELVDPTDSVVEMAFTAEADDPEEGDWAEASWETSGGRYYSRTLVGTGGTVLAEGNWHVWWRITRNPEVIVRMAPNLVVIT